MVTAASAVVRCAALRDVAVLAALINAHTFLYRIPYLVALYLC